MKLILTEPTRETGVLSFSLYPLVIWLSLQETATHSASAVIIAVLILYLRLVLFMSSPDRTSNEKRSPLTLFTYPTYIMALCMLLLQVLINVTDIRGLNEDTITYGTVLLFFVNIITTFLYRFGLLPIRYTSDTGVMLIITLIFMGNAAFIRYQYGMFFPNIVLFGSVVGVIVSLFLSWSTRREKGEGYLARSVPYLFAAIVLGVLLDAAVRENLPQFRSSIWLGIALLQVGALLANPAVRFLTRPRIEFKRRHRHPR